MSAPAIRIAMWSGPRNISTAMMRSFENRPDTAVVDEPFYAVYLQETGALHPMRDEVLASQPRDWRTVVEGLLGPVPGGRPVFYQKHMTHHMLPHMEWEWTRNLRNAFLIRAPEDVLLSYAQVRGTPSPEEIGIPQQRALFEREADRLGHAPPVIDGADVLRDPGRVLALASHASDGRGLIAHLAGCHRCTGACDSTAGRSGGITWPVRLAVVPCCSRWG